MLGRLEKSIAEAIAELLRVSNAVFNRWAFLANRWAFLANPRELLQNFLGRATGGYLWWPKHSSDTMRRSIQGIQGTNEEMQNHNSRCER